MDYLWVLVLFTLAIMMIWKPRLLWKIEHFFTVKNGEPTEWYCILMRIGGVFFLVCSIFVMIFVPLMNDNSDIEECAETFLENFSHDYPDFELLDYVYGSEETAPVQLAAIAFNKETGSSSTVFVVINGVGQIHDYKLTVTCDETMGVPNIKYTSDETIRNE